MNTLTRRIGVALTAALLATTAIAPMASARPFQGEQRQSEQRQQAWHGDSQHRGDWRGAPEQRADWHGEQHRDNGGDNGAGLALGIAALAGVAIWNASQPPAPAYQPAYPQPSYGQPYYAPTYVQPAYAQPSCTTINGAAACVGADGNWYYVR